MPHYFETFRIFDGDDFDGRLTVDRCGQIHEAPIELRRHGGLRKARSYLPGYLRHRRAVGDLQYAAIGQSDFCHVFIRHFQSSLCLGPCSA